MAGGRRKHADAGRPRVDPPARQARPALLRGKRVRGCPGARGGGGRRRWGGGDDLRARLRDPCRPRGRAGRGPTRRRAGSGTARPARALPLQRGRAVDRGDRARALPRPRPDPRNRRVLHGRHGRRPAHRRARVERRRARWHRRVRERGEDRGARGARGRPRRAWRRIGRGRRRDGGRRARAARHRCRDRRDGRCRARRRQRGEACRACPLPRLGARASRRAGSSRCLPTAPRSGPARPSLPCISCAPF